MKKGTAVPVVIRIDTSVGTLYARLNTETSPKTVQAFVKLVRKGFFKNTKLSGSDRSHLLLFPKSASGGDGAAEKSTDPLEPGCLVDYGRSLGVLIRPPVGDSRHIHVFGRVFRGAEAIPLLRTGIVLEDISEVSSEEDLPDDNDLLSVHESEDKLELTVQTTHQVRSSASPSGTAAIVSYFMPGPGGPRLTFTHLGGNHVHWTQEGSQLIDVESFTAIRAGQLRVRGDVALADDGSFALVGLGDDPIPIFGADGKLRVTVPPVPLDPGHRRLGREAVMDRGGKSLIVQEDTEPGGDGEVIPMRSLYKFLLDSKVVTRLHQTELPADGRGPYASVEYKIAPGHRFVSFFATRPDAADVEFDFLLFDTEAGTFQGQTRRSVWGICNRHLDIQAYRVWSSLNDRGELGVVFYLEGPRQEYFYQWCVFGADGRQLISHELHLPPSHQATDIQYYCWNACHALAYSSEAGKRDTVVLFSSGGDVSHTVDLKALHAVGARAYLDQEKALLNLVLLEHQRRPVTPHVRALFTSVDLGPHLDRLSRPREVGPADMSEAKRKMGQLEQQAPSAIQPVPKTATERQDMKKSLRQSYIEGRLSRREYRSRMAPLGVKFSSTARDVGGDTGG